MDPKSLETARRYNRIAPLYDASDWMMELWIRSHRKTLWKNIRGTDVLEIGVGTGKNIPFYPDDRNITAIDISDRMQRLKLGRNAGAVAYRAPSDDESR